MNEPFKLQQEPVVQPELKLQVANICKTLTAPEAIVQIIKLYGDEFEKANACIHEQRRVIAEQKSANDELFRLKQKVVIVNRELMQKNARLEKQVDAAKAFCAAHRDDYETLKTSDSMDVDAEFMLLFQAVVPDAC